MEPTELDHGNRASVGSPSGRTSALPSQANWDAVVFVTFVWLLMFVAAAGISITLANQIPTWDYFDVMPQLTGRQPVTPRWLWAQHNEHRIPIPKLALICLCRWTGDLRAPAVASVGLIGALAAWLAVCAASLRGRSDYADAFLPIALLNFGHCETFFAGFQLQFTLALFIGGLIVTAIACDGRRVWTQAIALGVLLPAVCLTGAGGLILAAPIAAWFGWASWRRIQKNDDERKLGAGLGLLVATGTLLLVVAYFVDYERVQKHPESPGLIDALRTTAQVCSVSLGPIAATSLDGWPAVTPIAVGPWLIAVVALLIILRRLPEERIRASGLLVFLLAVAAMVLLVGWGRSGLGKGAAFAPRYSVLWLPALLGAYFACLIYCSRPFSRFMQMSMFAVVCSLAPLNVAFEMVDGGGHRELVPVLQDVQRGVPPGEIASRHWQVLYNGPDPERYRNVVAEGFQMLKDANMGPYKK